MSDKPLVIEHCYKIAAPCERLSMASSELARLRAENEKLRGALELIRGDVWENGCLSETIYRLQDIAKAALAGGEGE